MPEMDGFEATRKIREIESHVSKTKIPIIALTANVMKEDQDRCRESGMNDFVSKPTKKDALGEAIKRWLEP